jgi:hypothetical protein
MDIFKTLHKFMKRGRIHKVINMLEETKHVRKEKRNRYRAAKRNP